MRVLPWFGRTASFESLGILTDQQARAFITNDAIVVDETGDSIRWWRERRSVEDGRDAESLEDRGEPPPEVGGPVLVVELDDGRIAGSTEAQWGAVEDALVDVARRRGARWDPEASGGRSFGTPMLVYAERSTPYQTLAVVLGELTRAGFDPTPVLRGPEGLGLQLIQQLGRGLWCIRGEQVGPIAETTSEAREVPYEDALERDGPCADQILLAVEVRASGHTVRVGEGRLLADCRTARIGGEAPALDRVTLGRCLTRLHAQRPNEDHARVRVPPDAGDVRLDAFYRASDIVAGPLDQDRFPGLY